MDIKKKILIVEDEKNIAMVLAYNIKRKDMTATLPGTGKPV